MKNLKQPLINKISARFYSTHYSFSPIREIKIGEVMYKRQMYCCFNILSFPLREWLRQLLVSNIELNVDRNLKNEIIN